MSRPRSRPEEIARACAELAARGGFPAPIAQGLAANDREQMRAAVTQLIDRGRVEGLLELADRFSDTEDLGVWRHVTRSRLRQMAGEFDAGLAEIDALMAHYPERAAAHWWVARGRCLDGLDRFAEAEATLREGAGKFPGVALLRVVHANMLVQRKRFAEAVQVWRDLIAGYPNPQPDWFQGLATSLRALGRKGEAADALDAGAAALGGAQAAPLAARAAQERGDFATAVDIWDAHIAQYGGASDPPIQTARAHALFNLWRIDEAIAALDAGLAAHPDDATLLRERAALAMEVGEVADAAVLLERLLERHPRAAKPDWYAALARARHNLWQDKAAEAALAALEKRFPASPHAEAERLWVLRDREYGHDALAARTAEALRRFPDNLEFRAQWVTMLLSYGRLEAAEREVVAMEAMASPSGAIGSRLRLESDRGEDSLRAYAQGLKARVTSAAEALQVHFELFTVRSPWAFDLAADILEEAAQREPFHLRVRLALAKMRIAQRRDEAALALIDTLPTRFRRYDFLQARAWAQARRGRHDDAKATWREALATSHLAAIHGPKDRMRRVSPDDRPSPGEGVTAYVVLRNEAALIPAFLAYHRRLGVRRFVFFDHVSTDASREIALSEPDVVVYDCPDSYQLSSSGRRWINEVVAQEGARGWGAMLDIDEHLIYPGCERVGIDAFVAYLDAHGFEGVRGYMLDVFPARLIGGDGRPAPLAEHRYYDDDYYLFGWERPPYLHPGGGVRARLFETKEYQHKTPLWRLDAGVVVSSHETTHLRFADVSCALLHYKLMNVALRGREATPEQAGAVFLEADSNVECVRRHARYAARLERLWDADLRAPGVSRTLEDSRALAARGLMDASPAYLAWLEGQSRA